MLNGFRVTETYLSNALAMKDFLGLEKVLSLEIFEAVKSYVLQVWHSHALIKFNRLNQDLVHLVPIKKLLFDYLSSDDR